MEFTKEDKEWILEASKDLEINQIAYILSTTNKKEVTKQDVKTFLKSVLNVNLKNQILFENQFIDEPITKDFIKTQIRAGVSQKVLALRLGLKKGEKLYWLLKEKNISWNEIKKEISKENKNNLGKLKCNHCDQVKNNTEFYLNKKTITGFSCWCKQCHRDYDKEARAKRKRSLKDFERRK